LNHPRPHQELGFLSKIDEWMQIIKPIYYPDSYLCGRPPKSLEIALRTYPVQNFFLLSDEGAEDAVVDIPLSVGLLAYLLMKMAYLIN